MNPTRTYLVVMLFALAVLAVIGLYFVLDVSAAGVSLALLAPFGTHWKKVRSVPYVSDGEATFEADKITFGKFRAFRIEFEGIFNKAGATAFGTLGDDAPFPLFQDVSWFDNDQVKKLPATFLRQIEHKMFRGLPDAQEDFVAPVAANTNDAVKFSIILSHEMFNSNVPGLTILDLRPENTTAVLTIKLGSVEKLIEGGDYTTKAFAAGAVINLYVLIDNSETRGIYSKFHYTFIEKQISSDPQSNYPVTIQTNQDVNFIAFGQYLKSPHLWIESLIEDDNDVSLAINGSTVWGPIKLRELRRVNRSTYGVDMAPGFGVLDFLHDKDFGLGKLSAIRTPDEKDPKRVNSIELQLETSSSPSAYLGVVVGSVRYPATGKG